VNFIEKTPEKGMADMGLIVKALGMFEIVIPNNSNSKIRPK
jgi:hypothetical protein